MTQDILALMGGLGFVGGSLFVTRRFGIDQWAWAAGLIALPLFYVGFGALAQDIDAIRAELLWGLPYFITGGLILLTKGKSTAALLITAIFWLLHAGYDFWHEDLFINPGVWDWYPLFCAVIDVSIFAYLIYLARHPATERHN